MEKTLTVRYTPARPRRRLPRPGLRSLAAVALIGCAVAVPLDALTPASPAPVAAVVAPAAHDVEAAHTVPAAQASPRPIASGKSKHHPLRHLLAPLRVVRHVHRVWRIVRHPFRFWLW